MVCGPAGVIGRKSVSVAAETVERHAGLLVTAVAESLAAGMAALAGGEPLGLQTSLPVAHHPIAQGLEVGHVLVAHLLAGEDAGGLGARRFQPRRGRG